MLASIPVADENGVGCNRDLFRYPPDIDRDDNVSNAEALEPHVRWLPEGLPVNPELLALADGVDPTEVFRFAAPCAEGGCQHYSGHHCRLGERLAHHVPAAFTGLPPRAVRPRCRWFAEQGRTAGARCPGIVTTDYRPSPELRAAADPDR